MSIVVQSRCIVIGPTRIWTAIAGFRIQSANRYTIGPLSSVRKLHKTRILCNRSMQQEMGIQIIIAFITAPTEVSIDIEERGFVPQKIKLWAQHAMIHCATPLMKKNMQKKQNLKRLRNRSAHKHLMRWYGKTMNVESAFAICHQQGVHRWFGSGDGFIPQLWDQSITNFPKLQF